MWIFTSLSSSLFNLFRLPLLPFIHIFNYTHYCILLPFDYLAKFESLYIYLYFAALIGILSGTILHLICSPLAALIDLQATPSFLRLEPESIKVAEDIIKERPIASMAKFRILPPRKENVSKAYNDYWETSHSAGERRGGLRGASLYTQPILEDSEDDS